MSQPPHPLRIAAEQLEAASKALQPMVAAAKEKATEKAFRQAAFGLGQAALGFRRIAEKEEAP